MYRKGDQGTLLSMPRSQAEATVGGKGQSASGDRRITKKKGKREMKGYYQNLTKETVHPQRKNDGLALKVKYDSSHGIKGGGKGPLLERLSSGKKSGRAFRYSSSRDRAV